MVVAIEVLVDITIHKEASMFTKTYSICKKYEDNVDSCSLILKLFRSAEDEKKTNLLADWAKTKKNESSGKYNQKQVQHNNGASCVASHLQSVPNLGFMHPYMPE